MVVLFADLVESVRLFRDFERSVIERWHGFVRRVEDELAAQHRGRLVRSAGDGLLLEFASALDATAASFSLHQALEGFNKGCPSAERFQLRIGVHADQVVSFAHELYGAGVNIAARLASLAQPGQTLASAQVRQALADGVHAHVIDLGLRYAKHVEEPLRVFRLEPPQPGGLVQVSADPNQDLRPTVAVVPFVAIPSDPSHDAIGHALADDIIASLARHPSLRVLSRVSTAVLRGSDTPQAFRESLGASFLLSGQYYVQGSRVRLSFELSELDGCSVLWTGRTVGDVQALFEGTDELVPHIVTQVSQQIIGRELSRARSLPVDALSSYTLFLGASGLLHSLVKSDFQVAREVFEHLAERHPRHAAPLAMLSRWQVFALEQGWVSDRSLASQLAREYCERALDRDPHHGPAHAALGQVCSNFEGDLGSARELNQRAIELEPSDALAWAQLSAMQAFLGETDESCASVVESLRLSPLDPSRYLFETYAALAFIAAGDYARAVTYAASSVRQHALHAPGLHLLVGAQWLNGEHEAARRTTQRYLQLDPKATAGPGSRRRLGHGQSWRAHFEQALISAGVPP
ncbi:hypothetical protein KAK06_15155 [Ideonella sp. 4Y11]|uniref:Guanylate cyclase domain-containing protein n=1 Tax=Ideonella aquatica TaxID=2824119 RepID=A0A940YLR7_9BURK|nr:adenylate/guanylate cyclase domain-containing protein [Ideonella aquatica]MBQ0960291.1 hypothetical protein [Ideonella aquatica]